MIRCAIYARRSTEEHQAASLDVQVGEASAYAAKQGWTVLSDHVYRDDGVSRAEFKRRPGLIALVNAAKRGAFDVLVLRDESRLGGDMLRTALVTSELIEAKVRVFYYDGNQEVRLDGAHDKILLAVRSYASELEREKIASRTREHLATKARKGFNVGGRCFGYDNVPIELGDRRDHVEYRINEEQAAIVRDVFARYAKGQGFTAIAKALNAAGVPSPRLRRRGTGSWAPSCVRAMLLRERYRGMLVWGREGKAYRGGTRVRESRPESAVERVERADLRIVSEDVWAAVQARMKKHQSFSGRFGPGGPKARYLLSGLLRCAHCGGPLQAVNGKQGSGIVKVYTCSWHRTRGPSVCPNSARRPVDSLDDAVTRWIRVNVLRAEVTRSVLAELRARLKAKSVSASVDAPRLEARARAVRAEIARLTDALATSSESPRSLVEAVAERERALAELEGQLAIMRQAPSVLSLEVRRMEQQAEARLRDLRSLLKRHPEDARRALEALLDGPLRATPIDTPEGKRFRIDGSAAIGAMFTTEGDPNGN